MPLGSISGRLRKEMTVEIGVRWGAGPCRRVEESGKAVPMRRAGADG